MKNGELTLNQIVNICSKRRTCEGCELAFNYDDAYNHTPNTCCLLHHLYPEEWDKEYLEKEVEEG